MTTTQHLPHGPNDNGLLYALFLLVLGAMLLGITTGCGDEVEPNVRKGEPPSNEAPVPAPTVEAPPEEDAGPKPPPADFCAATEAWCATPYLWPLEPYSYPDVSPQCYCWCDEQSDCAGAPPQPGSGLVAECGVIFEIAMVNGQPVKQPRFPMSYPYVCRYTEFQQAK